MDPITHGLLGAAIGQATAGGAMRRRAAIAGAAAAMSPDLDFMLRPLGDPALPWELHRHFTHALVFTPAGAAATLLLFLPLAAFRRSLPALYGVSLLAYLSHGLLDAATSYGTHWLWPFSSARMAWDLIAIVDPIFSLTLLIGIVLSVRRRAARPAVLALLLAAVYLGLGGVQHARAGEAQRQAARSRGHQVVHSRAMPTLGNIFLWRGLYVAQGRIHADAILAWPWRKARIVDSSWVPLSEPAGWPAPPASAGRITGILQRFNRFADGFTALAPDHPGVVGDMRYSLDTGGFEPLWGVRVDPESDGDPVAWANLLEGGPGFHARLLRVLTGRSTESD